MSKMVFLETPNFNKSILELKIRGNENVILSISSFCWLFLFSALNTHSTRKNTEYLFKNLEYQI